MITKALRDYLVSSDAITGYPATVFRTAQTVGGLSVVDREDARRYFQSRVNDKDITATSRPREGSQHTAVTLRTIATDTDDEVTGGTEIAATVVQVDVWARYKDAPVRAHITGTLLRLCCEGFGGANWGDTYIADCQAQRRMEFAEAPKQGGDWEYRYSMDLRVHHQQASAVI